MAKNDNLTDFLTDVAYAIRTKKGVTRKINPQDFAWEIASIPTGDGNTPTPDMPVIGDGKTYLYIKIATKGRMKVQLCFSQNVANGVTVDWGDGSTTQTSSEIGFVYPSHTYAEVGEYTISLNPLSECKLRLSPSSSPYCVMGRTANKERAYCNMLKAVEIGKNVTSIGSYEFQLCHSLASIVIPQGITSIGYYAFYQCSSLASVVIPRSVTSIDIAAFYQCYSLASVVIPDSVTSVGHSAFSNCHALASVVIPNSITSIANSMFSNCHALASVVIPNGVTSIGEQAFYWCYSLASVVIPQSVTSIGNGAFGSCFGMAYYDFTQCTSIPTLGGTDVFYEIASDCKIVVPDALYDEWKAAENWSTYATYIIKASEFNG